MRTRVLSTLLIILFGCDSKPKQVYETPKPPRTVLLVTALAQALPARGVSLAIDSLGNYYWTQPTDDAHDTVYVASASALPKPTRLTSDAILARLEEMFDAKPATRRPTTGTASPASGNILALVGGPTGEIYFYFSGSQRRESHHCLGRFDVATGQIRILADTARLETSTGLGKSILLADAKLLRAGNMVYLWLRHTDASMVLSINPRTTGGTEMPPLTPVLKEIRVSGQSETIDLTSRDVELSSSASDDMIVTDTARGVVWRVDPAGTATEVATLIGLPRDFSPPIGTRRGDVLAFVAPSPSITSTDTFTTPAAFMRMQFPALLRFGATETTSIQRDDLRAPPGFPAYAMRLEQILETREPETYLAYDANSGQILKLKIDTQ